MEVHKIESHDVVGDVMSDNQKYMMSHCHCQLLDKFNTIVESITEIIVVSPSVFFLLTSIPQGSVAVSIMLFRSVAMFSRSDSSSDRVFVPRMFLCGKIFTLWYTWINRYLVRLFEH